MTVNRFVSISNPTPVHILGIDLSHEPKYAAKFQDVFDNMITLARLLDYRITVRGSSDRNMEFIGNLEIIFNKDEESIRLHIDCDGPHNIIAGTKIFVRRKNDDLPPLELETPGSHIATLEKLKRTFI